MNMKLKNLIASLIAAIISTLGLFLAVASVIAWFYFMITSPNIWILLLLGSVPFLVGFTIYFYNE